MKDLRNDAARLSFLHDVGIVSSEEIVKWADGLIVSEEKPSQALIELSISSGKMVGDVLRQMAVGADVWSPIEEALPKILERVLGKPESAPIIARAFYHVAVTSRESVIAYAERQKWYDPRKQGSDGKTGAQYVRGELGEYRIIFVTSVTVFWEFDSRSRLERIRVRKTVDAL